MLKKLLLVLLFIHSSLFASNINIAVAANVSYAIDTLTKEFNTIYPKTNVRVTLGSSGKLTAQIKNGAPYELFMSANMKYPNNLYANKLAVTKPLVYAKGSLALLSRKPQNFSKGLFLLLDTSIKKIAIANPKTAPYGVATIEAMSNAGIYQNIYRKFVFGESISQTVTYAIIASDIGIVATSSLYSPRMKHFKENIHWSTLDIKLYTPIKQGIVILKNGQNKPEVKAFYDFIQSNKAKKIFKEFGYSVHE